jgi:hypothetical protein
MDFSGTHWDRTQYTGRRYGSIFKKIPEQLDPLLGNEMESIPIDMSGQLGNSLVGTGCTLELSSLFAVPIALSQNTAVGNIAALIPMDRASGEA